APEVLGPYTPHLRAALFVTPGARGTAIRLPTSRSVQVGGGWGDRQHLADRRDPVLVAMLVDEGHHHFGRRSSSAWAKYAEALRRISFARFSSRFSRSSSFRRSFSLVVRPARSPASRSACRTHVNKVCGVQPIFPAMDVIAAHCDGCWSCCSTTSRTALSRTSAGYLLALPMPPSSQGKEPPRNPGRFNVPSRSFFGKSPERLSANE